MIFYSSVRLQIVTILETADLFKQKQLLIKQMINNIIYIKKTPVLLL